MQHKNLLFLALLSSAVYAENSTTEDVVVTASRLPESASSTLVDMQVVTAKDITKHNAKNLTDVLKLMSGFQFISYGGRGQASNFYVRGSKAEHVLVLLDGNALNSSGIGAVNANFIPVNMIERVEFLRGQRATVYGANAITGVINIITKPVYKNKQSMSYTYSTDNTHDLNTNNVIAATDDFVVKFAGGVSSSDGYNVHPVEGMNTGDEHGFKAHNIELLTSYMTPVDIELYASYNFMKSRGDYDNSFYMHEMDVNELERNIFTLGSKYQSDFYLYDLGLMYSQNNDYNYIKGGSKFDPMTSNFKVNAFTSHFTNQFNVIDTALAVGFGVDFDNNILQKESTSYSTPFGDHDISMVNRSAHLYVKSDTQWILGEVAARIDDNSYFGNHGSYNAGIGVKLADFVIGVRGGTAFRAPTLSELYMPYYGNKHLNEEKANNIEFSVKGRIADASMYLNAYYTKYDDLISYDYATSQYYNTSEAKIQGIELGGDYTFTYLTLKASIDLVDPKDEDTDKTLTYRAKQMYKLSASGAWQDLDYNAMYSFTSKRYTSTEPLGGYGLVNLGLGYTWLDHVRFGIQVDNVFDKHYEQSAGYPTPGAVVAGTVELKNFF